MPVPLLQLEGYIQLSVGIDKKSDKKTGSLQIGTMLGVASEATKHARTLLRLLHMTTSMSMSKCMDHGPSKNAEESASIGSVPFWWSARFHSRKMAESCS